LALAAVLATVAVRLAVLRAIPLPPLVAVTR